MNAKRGKFKGCDANKPNFDLFGLLSEHEIEFSKFQKCKNVLQLWQY